MPLSEIAIKRQADNLQRSLKTVYGLISDRYTVFRELCRVVNPERGYSPTAVKEIKARYKEINAKFTEARTLYQMLRAKYKGYIQIDSQLLREIEDLSLMYRKDFRFFEHTHTTCEQGARGKDEASQRILSHLHEVYLERPSFPSLILYFKGDAASLGVVKSRMRLGTMDMCEQREDEMWVLLTGIRSSSDEILQKKLLDALFQGPSTIRGIRGIVVKVNTEHDAREEVLGDMPSVIDELQDGEIKIL